MQHRYIQLESGASLYSGRFQLRRTRVDPPQIHYSWGSIADRPLSMYDWITRMAAMERTATGTG